MINNNLVVFDLDGTLNRTELYAVPAHKKALAEYGITNITDEQIISHFGARIKDCLKFYFGRELSQAEETEYLKRSGTYENEFMVDNHGEYDGITDMLKTLRQNGYKTAVCSNASERYIRLVLSTLNILQYIDFIQPLLEGLHKQDTLKILVQSVNPEKCVMVGDRIYDKNAATANNIPFIGCAYGFNKEEILDADAVVYTASEIPSAVKNLIG
ncbi:MAG: HAD-IA family hydrolase [Oscillospiraceae bacterium]